MCFDSGWISWGFNFVARRFYFVANPSLDFRVLSSAHLTVVLYYHTVDYRCYVPTYMILQTVKAIHATDLWKLITIYYNICEMSQFCCDSIVRAWLPYSYLYKDVAMGGEPRNRRTTWRTLSRTGLLGTCTWRLLSIIFITISCCLNTMQEWQQRHHVELPPLNSTLIRWQGISWNLSITANFGKFHGNKSSVGWLIFMENSIPRKPWKFIYFENFYAYGI